MRGTLESMKFGFSASTFDEAPALGPLGRSGYLFSSHDHYLLSHY